jgi:hypothetical protein
MRDAMPSSFVECCAGRVGGALAAADGLIARRGGRLLGWYRSTLAMVGLGGLSILVVEVAPLPGTVAALLLAVVRSLTVDGESGSWHARGHVVATGGEACGTGE